MADATWLAKARNDYGEGSIWWRSHVLAEFPDSAADSLIPRDWLDRAGAARHVPRGPRRLAIDLAEGGGGDRTVLLVRDDNGVIEVRHSNRWKFPDAARKAAELVRTHGIAPGYVTWDATGSGAGFLAYLEAAGVASARGYKGGTSGGDHFDKRKAAAGWSLRMRLDPARQVAGPHGLHALQIPFAIPAEYLALLRPELQAIRFVNVNEKQIGLEKAELLKAALGHSPDFADALVQSYSY
jgi:hypothetical protein